MKRFIPFICLILAAKISVAQNVGIGTINPLSKLHIYGPGEILRLQGITPFIGMMNEVDPEYQGFLFYPDTAIVVGTTAGTNKKVVLAPNNIGLLWADAPNGGRIGIGTAAPLSRLHVQSDNTGDGLRITAPSATVQLFSGSNEQGFMKASDNLFKIGTALVTADMAMQVGNNDIMRLSRNGNVGINSLPNLGTVLLADGLSFSNDILRLRSNDNPELSWYTQTEKRASISFARSGAFSSVYSLDIKHYGNEGLILLGSATNNNTAMNINPQTGDVGIGNPTNPGSLTVNGFTYLGNDLATPGIKMKVLSGNLPASGATVQIPLGGIDPNNILAVNMHVNSTLNFKTPPGSSLAGFQYDYLIVGGNIEITPKAGNSLEVALQPVTILVTYRN